MPCSADPWILQFADEHAEAVRKFIDGLDDNSEEAYGGLRPPDENDGLLCSKEQYGNHFVTQKVCGSDRLVEGDPGRWYRKVGREQSPDSGSEKPKSEDWLLNKQWKLELQEFLYQVSTCQKSENYNEKGHNKYTKQWKSQELPYRTKRPSELPPGDDRFNSNPKERVFVCDHCGIHVGFCSTSGQSKTGCQGTFQGSFCDKAVAKLPVELQRKLYDEQRIDATWNCCMNCQAEASSV